MTVDGHDPEYTQTQLLEHIDHLQIALNSRIVIEQAKGILAHSLDISVDEAFDVLRKSARDKRIKIHNLAATIAASPREAQSLIKR